MNGTELLDQMGQIDPAYVEAADAIPLPRRKRRVRWSVIAACLCFVMGAVVTMAVSGAGTRLIQGIVAPSESENPAKEREILYSLRKIPFSAFKGKIQEAPQKILDQFDHYDPYQCTMPEHLLLRFDSYEEMLAYIGLDELRDLPWAGEEKLNSLLITGNKTGAVEFLSLSTLFSVGDLQMTYSIRAATNSSNGEISLLYTHADTDFSFSSCTTPQGRECLIVKKITPSEKGYYGIAGYILENGILYKLHIPYLESEADQAMEALSQWIHSF